MNSIYIITLKILEKDKVRQQISHKRSIQKVLDAHCMSKNDLRTKNVLKGKRK